MPLCDLDLTEVSSHDRKLVGCRTALLLLRPAQRHTLASCCDAPRRARDMHEFRLFAHGADFDPDAYLASTQLAFDDVWRKGDRGGSHPKSSGVYKVLGDGKVLSIAEQQD